MPRTILATLAMVCAAAQGCGGGGAGARTVPITTTSEEARQAYLESRDSFDNFLMKEARAQAERAVALDERFALAYLMMASTSGSTTEFFESVDRAVSLAGDVSEGERHVILGFAAGAKGDPETQRDHYRALVLAFPDDERAHFLLAGYFFRRQEWKEAIEHYRRAIELNPAFPPPYNQLGYALRFSGDYEEAEKAFREYVRLMPGEPNPLDSYAELLMQQGRFEESIDKYREALERNPEFIPSYIGIGNNLIFLGEPAEARLTFSMLGEVASTDAERREALFWTAVSYLHEGRFDDALDTVRDRYAMAERAGDLATAAEDRVLLGDILVEAGRAQEAVAEFRTAAELIQRSDSPEEVKKSARRNLLYHEALAALGRGDAQAAKALAERFRDRVGDSKIPSEVRSQRELFGLVALAEGDYGGAVSLLLEADPGDPRVLYELALAYQGAGDADKARGFAKRAADFNGLSIRYAYVRRRAEELLERLESPLTPPPPRTSSSWNPRWRTEAPAPAGPGRTAPGLPDNPPAATA
jgi:tetratricopeptide (TPR) repeat protein